MFAIRDWTHWQRRIAGLPQSMEFQRQLAWAVGLGVVCIALLSSLVSSWQASTRIRAQFIDQGQQIALSLASQSSFALLSSASDNAAVGIATTLAFPDVTRVEIVDAGGRVLVARGVLRPGDASPSRPGDPATREAYLGGETKDTWIFVAPVWTRSEPSPFEVVERRDERLGEVRVVQSKATLHRLTTGVFLTNLVVSLLLAALFLFAIRVLGGRLTRPLTDLAAAMARAERGAAGVHAKVYGPRDIGAMAQGFNQMISALGSREEELQRHRDHLEELVHERTRELLVAKDRAEVASRAKTDFLAGMSHELRTPLNAVLGYAQILQMDEGLSPSQRQGLATIQSSGEHLLTLIVDILDLSRIEAGKIELATAPVQLRALIGGIADIIRIRAEDKRVEFVVDDAGIGAHAADLDEKRLRQVLLNLLGNAVKFTDRGRVTLGATLLALEGRRLRLRFEVADTGVGIAADHVERIFQPFEQVGDVARRAGGTGLGLAISRRLVRLMGGDIQVESRPGAGSRFWFDLELPAADPLPAPAPAAADIVGYDGPRRCILVVDDVADNRAMLGTMLRTLGFEVEEAADGAQAVARVRMRAPDLVLMDMVMPVMDGLEATRLLRAEAVGARLPIVGVSANASSADRARCMAAGASAFCQKPIERPVLLALLAQHLKLDWIRAGPAPDARRH